MSGEVLPNLFIIGMPRSGTKLMRTLLNNHSSIYIPNIETAFIPSLIQKFAGKELNEADIAHAVGRIRGSIFFFYYLKNNEFDFDRLMLRPGCTIYDILKAFYIELSGSSFADHRYIGDKTPRNIYSASVLALGFREAKFIHLIRDPRDYALSVKRAWGKNELRAVFLWVKGVSAFQHAIVAAKRQFIEVRYEDLLADPASTLKRCTDFLQLDYEPSMLQLSETIEKSGDARDPVIKRDNAGKYLQKMTPLRVRRIDDYTVELLRRYGYPCSSDRLHNRPISTSVEGVLRAMDTVILLRNNMQQLGLRRGLEKIIRSSR